MKTWTSLSLAVTISAIAAMRVDAVCTSSLGYFGNQSGVSMIMVSTSDYPNDNHIGSAIEHWADGCTAEYGSAFPEMKAGSSCPWYASCGFVDIVFVNAPGTQGCGDYQANQDPGTGGTMFIYGWDSLGRSCIENDIDGAATIAHELGHALGLADSECTTGIMGTAPPIGQIRDVSSSECDVTSNLWFTPAEEEQEDCDLQCMEPCTGTPPSCADPGGPGDPGCADLCSCTSCSPLVFDLNGDGIHTTSLDSDAVSFDFTGDSILDRGGWTDRHTEEGILYYDRNRNQMIDGAQELFGDRTLMQDGSRAANGFEALGAYDAPRNGGNGDRVISPGDRMWGRIRMWIDRNHDGVCSNDENYSLGQLHISSINLTYIEAIADESYGFDEAGNWHRFKGSFVQRFPGGSKVSRSVHDVYFKVIHGRAVSDGGAVVTQRATANRQAGANLGEHRRSDSNNVTEDRRARNGNADVARRGCLARDR